MSASEISLTKATETVNPKVLNELFRATFGPTEEAILDSIFTRETMKGRDDNVSRGLPIDEALEVTRAHGMK